MEFQAQLEKSLSELGSQVDAKIKEANAQATRLANHTTTLANEYARQGRDWEAELRQRAKERQLMEELGLSSADLKDVTQEEEDAIDDDETYQPQAA